MKKRQENLPMNLGISRVATNCGEGYISLEIQDDTSSMRFVRLQIPLKNFAKAVTGLHGVKCTGEVVGLDNIGKKMEIDQLTFKMPDNTRDKEVAKETAFKECPEGWVPDTGFNSQNSFSTKDGEYYAHTTIRRWVEIEKKD